MKVYLEKYNKGVKIDECKLSTPEEYIVINNIVETIILIKKGDKIRIEY